MNPQDDPEARIRALEQPLSDVARASELGTDQQYSSYGYTPPPPPTAQWPYPGGYQSGFPTTPTRSGLRPWMLIVPVMIGFLVLAGGIVTWVLLQNTAVTRTSPGISGGGGLITSAAPSRRSTVNQAPTAVPTAAPSQTLPQPGSTVASPASAPSRPSPAMRTWWWSVARTTGSPSPGIAPA